MQRRKNKQGNHPVMTKPGAKWMRMLSENVRTQQETNSHPDKTAEIIPLPIITSS
jgi:hypothetical protein